MDHEFIAQKKSLHDRIQAKIIEFRKRFDDLWEEQDPTVVKQRTKVLETLCIWYHMDNALKFNWGVQDIGNLAYAVREFISNYREWRLYMNSRQATIASDRRAYEKQWDRILRRLRYSERMTTMILSPQALQRFGFNELDDVSAMSVSKDNRESLLQELKSRKTVIVSSIVKALAIGCNKTSIIDAQYNTTKLNLFRTYYKLQSDSNNGVKALEKELLALEAQYTSLVDHAKL